MKRTLEQRLAAAEETIAALKRRVEDKVASGESAFGILEQSIALERLVAERTGQLEESLRKNREANLALALAQEVSHTGNWVWQVGASDVTRSAEYCRMLGLDPVASSATCDAEMEFVHPHDRARVQDLLAQALLHRTQFETDYRIVRADGQVRFVHARGRVLDEPGEPLRMIGTRQDVTEMKEMQARLGVAERMASLGTLAGGAAHEIMNPLAYATSNASFVTDQLSRLEGRALLVNDGSPLIVNDLRQALGEALSGLERIRRVVENLRAFSHGDHALGPADLRQAIELAIQMAASEIRDRARLTRDFRPVFPVEGDVSRLGQVFLNLLVNASQAIPAGNPDENEILIVMRMRDTAHALVEIHDTGSGIPSEIRNRVFDPFFTTRPIGRGMGLGLSVCHGIVRALGGDIDFESEVGRGTTFRVVLRATRSLSQRDEDRR
jgi:PAS domain S-box-containing protein